MIKAKTRCPCPLALPAPRSPSIRPTLDADAPQTLPVGSFSAPQLRKAKPACDACCGVRAEKGGPDHVPKAGKSAKEKRLELRELRERKKKEEADTKAEAAEAAAAVAKGKLVDSGLEGTAVAAAPDGPVVKKARVSPEGDDRGADKERAEEKEKEKKKDSTKDFVATERFDPTAESSDDEGDDSKSKDAVGGGGSSGAGTGGGGGAEDGKDLSRRQIYVGGIPFYKWEEEIKEAFDSEGLPVEALDCMKFPDSGRFRGIAIVTFTTAHAARGALAWNGEEWDGKFLVVRKYAPKTSTLAARGDKDGGADGARPAQADLLKVEGQHVAFVANLNWDVTEVSLGLGARGLGFSGFGVKGSRLRVQG